MFLERKFIMAEGMDLRSFYGFHAHVHMCENSEKIWRMNNTSESYKA